MLVDEKLENVELDKLTKDIECVVGVNSETEEALTDQISEAIDNQNEQMVSDAVEEAVEEALDDWIQELIDYYNINPEAIIEIGDDYIIIDCELTECFIEPKYHPVNRVI